MEKLQQGALCANGTRSAPTETEQRTYESVRNIVYCTGIEWLCKDGRSMVQFTADEAALISRLGGNGGKDTAANFEQAVHGAADGYEKKMISRAAHKLSELLEEGCAELVHYQKPQIIRT